MADATAAAPAATASEKVRKASKRYHAQRSQVDRNKLYTPLEALTLLKTLGSSKFDEAVEFHAKLGLDVRKADQMLRSTISLPNGIGKTVTVAVFAQGEKQAEAEKAGADFVGGDDLAEKIQGGWTDFDVCIATPDMMGTVGKLGRILGPRSLMPNPKTGTVTFDVAQAVEASKGGKFEYRTDRFGIVHCVIGRKSFEANALVENYGAMLDELLRAKPASAKGRYIQSIFVTTTQAPGIPVDPSKTRDLLENDAS
jgi:large subunit ribosomal protein L1